MGRAVSDDEPIWLGLDLGTQGIRALAVSGSGRVAGRGSQPLASRRDGHCHEQDPEAWWAALADASRAALSELAPERVQGLAMAGTSGSILFVDEHGTPLTPGLMYDDSRATDQARRVNDAVVAAAHRLPTHPIPAQWALPKTLWMLEQRPELARGARLEHQTDFIARRLVGHEVSADWSHALKTGYDLVEDRWPRELLDGLGVPEGLLPEVVRPGSLLGTVGERAAAQTGIAAGTSVIAGMTDGCAAQLAAGALSEGEWSSALGTSLVLKGVSPALIRDPNGVLYSHRAPGGGWLPGGASSTGAGVLSARFPARDLDDLGRRAAAHERTAVLAYPLLSRGERFPFAAPDAEGFLLGRASSEDEHFAALLQGLAFVERLCFDYVDLLGAPTDGELSLTGGATRGRYLCQLRADVLGRPVRLPENPEPALGMAMLAASGDRSLAETAAGMVRTRELVGPRTDRAGLFHEPYVRLVGELEARGWLGSDLADHARGRL